MKFPSPTPPTPTARVTTSFFQKHPSHNKDGVFECKGTLPKGTPGRGYYNLGGGSPISGHLCYEKCEAVYIDEARRLHILISEIAEHTGNILKTGHASAMLIDDESATAHIFARRRATFDCEASARARDTPEWTQATAAFKAHFRGSTGKGHRQVQK